MSEVLVFESLIHKWRKNLPTSILFKIYTESYSRGYNNHCKSMNVSVGSAHCTNLCKNLYDREMNLKCSLVTLENNVLDEIMKYYNEN